MLCQIGLWSPPFPETAPENPSAPGVAARTLLAATPGHVGRRKSKLPALCSCYVRSDCGVRLFQKPPRKIRPLLASLLGLCLRRHPGMSGGGKVSFQLCVHAMSDLTVESAFSRNRPGKSVRSWRRCSDSACGDTRACRAAEK